MKMSEHIRHCQQMLDKHGDFPMAVEFNTRYESWTVHDDDIAPVSLATGKLGTKFYLIEVELREDDDGTEPG